MSAEGVTLSGVLWNTKLCTDTTLESPIQLGAEGAKMADRAIPISQAKGQRQAITILVGYVIVLPSICLCFLESNHYGLALFFLARQCPSFDAM